MAKSKDKSIDPELSDIEGVGPTTAEKLKLHGFAEVINLVGANVRELAGITGLSEPSCRKIIENARELLHMDFEKGTKVDKDQSNIRFLTFGCKPLDNLIGGLRAKWVTEAYGQWGSGKSQVAFQLCVTSQLPEEQGGFGEDAKVVYIDSESTFVTSRIKDIAKAKGLDPEKVLNNILYVNALSSDHQVFAIQEVAKKLQNKENIKLIIIDSLTAHFRSEFNGRGELYDRQSALNHHLRFIKNLAIQYDLAVYVTNQVMSNPASMFGDPIVAVGGNILGHGSSTRIYLRKAAKGTRVAKLVDSPYVADGECTFIVTQNGLEEV